MRKTSILYRSIALFLIAALLTLTLPQPIQAAGPCVTVDLPLPSFRLLTTEDETITEADFIGKTSIIIFGKLDGSDSSCYNTDYNIASILGSALIAHGVQVVSVDISDSPFSTVRSYQETQDPGNLITYCLNGSSCLSSFLKLFKINSFATPLMVLVDKNGQIRCYMTANQTPSTITDALSLFDPSIPKDSVVNLSVKGIAHYADANDVTDNVNSERQAVGLGRLDQDYELTELAMKRAAEIALYYSHDRPNGEPCASILEGVASAYTTVGENIAFVSTVVPDADEVMDSWMNSPGHRANILDSSFKSIGVGCFSTGECTYWVQIFSSDEASRTANIYSLKHVTYPIEIKFSYVNISAIPYVNNYTFKLGEAKTLKYKNINPLISNVSFTSELDSSCLKFVTTGPLNIAADGTVTASSVGSGQINVTLRANDDLARRSMKLWYYNIVEPAPVGGDPVTKPVSYLPRDDETDFGTYHKNYVSFSDLAITFPSKVKILSATDYKPILDFSAGSIRIVDTSTNTIIWTARKNSSEPNTCAEISVSTTQTVFHILPGNRGTMLSPGVTYRVEVDPGVICFEDGTTNTAITDWNFTTVSHPHYPAPLVKSGSFKYSSHLRAAEDKSSKEAGYTYSYNENWFFQSNDTYNHDLAKMSLRMATCASETKENHIVELFSDLGYTNPVYEFPSPTQDTIGYAIGSKQVENANGELITLIAVVIRSGAYKAEWGSNFEVGVASEHAGFAKAGSTVYNAVRNYISTLDNPENIKIWLSGYSRGAATANIAAQRLSADGKYSRIKGLSEKNIYAYCFACPRNVRTDAPAAKLEYKGLYNVVAYNDFVTMVAPEDWGFTRYGTTLILPSAELSYKNFDSINTKMKVQYQAIGKQAGVSANTVLDACDFSRSQGNDLNKDISAIAELFQSQSVYAAGYQDSVCNLLAKVNSSPDVLTANDISLMLFDLTAIIGGSIAQFPAIVDIIRNVDGIMHAHFPEHYIAWMDTISGLSDFTRQQSASGKFSDVSSDAYYNDAVTWAVENNVTTGTDDSHFSPDNICTRAQLVVFLWRAMGCPEPVGSTSVFKDVPSNAYYLKAVLWASQNNITTGTDSTHFSPDNVVTRAQAVTFLYRTYNGSKSGISNPFADVAYNAYYRDPVLWAYANGITTGTDKTHFSPDNPLTRAQAVTFLYRAATK